MTARTLRREVIPDPLAALADVLDPPENPHAGNPVGWVEDRLGGFVWSAQRELMRSAAENRYTAAHAAHDLGKSAAAARLACWWLDTHPIGEAFVVSTAPTWAQVKAILWREIRKVREAARVNGRSLPGEVTMQCEWHVGGDLIAMGRKPADHDQGAFQGIHARYVLVLIDEACGVPKALWDAADALATNEHARVVAIGNPDDPTAHFERVCRPGSGFNVIHMNGLSSPNFTAEAVAALPEVAEVMAEHGIEPSTEEVPGWMRPLLLSPLWVAERVRRWGRRSPLFTSKVLGMFPDVGDNVLLTPRVLRAAVERELPGIERGRYGLDVARFGADSTVAVRNRGGVLRIAYRRNGLDTHEVAEEVHAMIAPHHGGVPVVVDTIGLGAGVFDALRAKGDPVVSFDASARPVVAPGPGDPRFANRRAEQWWAVREMFEAGEADLDPEDEDLIAQLGSLRWKVDARGIISVESKEEWVKRMGPGTSSPDEADAAMMSTVASAPEPPPRTSRPGHDELLSAPM